MAFRKDVLGELLETGAYSDLELTCQGYTFQLHKNIVFSHSAVLKDELLNQPKESRANEIQINQFDLEVVKAMVDFMYGKDYDVAECSTFGYENNQGNNQDWIADSDERCEAYFHTMVHVISGRYQVAGLGDSAARKLDKLMEDIYDEDMHTGIIAMVFNLSRDRGLQDLVARWSLDEVPLIRDGDDDDDGAGDVNGRAVLEFWAGRLRTMESNLTESVAEANTIMEYGCEVCAMMDRSDFFVLEPVPGVPGMFQALCRNCTYGGQEE